jgi:hypothetical protein
MFYVYIIRATRPCLVTADAGTVVVFLIQHGYEILSDERQDDGAASANPARVVIVQKLRVPA